MHLAYRTKPPNKFDNDEQILFIQPSRGPWDDLSREAPVCAYWNTSPIGQALRVWSRCKNIRFWKRRTWCFHTQGVRMIQMLRAGSSPDMLLQKLSAGCPAPLSDSTLLWPNQTKWWWAAVMDTITSNLVYTSSLVYTCCANRTEAHHRCSLLPVQF